MNRPYWRAYLWFWGVLMGITGIMAAAYAHSDTLTWVAGIWTFFAISRMERWLSS